MLQYYICRGLAKVLPPFKSVSPRNTIKNNKIFLNFLIGNIIFSYSTISYNFFSTSNDLKSKSTPYYLKDDFGFSINSTSICLTIFSF